MKHLTRRHLLKEALERAVDRGARFAGIGFRRIEELEQLDPIESGSLIPTRRSDTAFAIVDNGLWRRRQGHTALDAELTPLEAWLADAADGRRSLASLLNEAPGMADATELQHAFMRLVRLEVLIPATPPPPRS